LHRNWRSKGLPQFERSLCAGDPGKICLSLEGFWPKRWAAPVEHRRSYRRNNNIRPETQQYSREASSPIGYEVLNGMSIDRPLPGHSPRSDMLAVLFDPFRWRNDH
jgi:hypothetical protein